MAAYGAWSGVIILWFWDRTSSSEQQLALERKTYLLSTLMGYVLAVEVLSTLLFIYTLDDIHSLFVGAMCATGSLNANPVGWWALLVKIVTLFFCAAWIVVNRIDQRAEDYPLTRTKYGLLLILAPLLALEAWLQLRYFAGLDPSVITSCCGALFSGAGVGVAADISGLPAFPLMAALFGGSGLYIVVGALTLWQDKAFLRYIMAAMAVALCGVALASVIAFVSPYYYELPTHHCPFDMLQADYDYIGYPLYICLFGATFYGLMVGATQPMRRATSVDAQIAAAQHRWTRRSLVLISLFIVIAVWPMLFSDFTLEGYY